MNATIEAYKKDVDRTLLRENLKRTPQERFERFEEFMISVMELREAGIRHRQIHQAKTQHSENTHEE